MTTAIARRLGVPRTRRAGAALALAAAATSGVSIFVNQFAVKQAPNAAVYTTSKNLVAALVLAAVAAATMGRGVARTARRVPRSQWIALLLVGVFGGGLAFALFFEGLRETSATDAALLQKTLLIWVAIAAVPILGERLNAGHVAALALLVAGQVFLIGSAGIAHAGAGDALILAATLIWSAEIILVRALLRQLPSQLIAVARMLIGCAFLLAYLVIGGQGHGLVALGPAGWMWALGTGALLALYVSTWFAALSRAPAIDVTAILVVGALVTAVLDATAGHAALLPHALGLGLILAGTGAMVIITVRVRARPDMA
jgi:drug/metabolite transporter (DMT)-like permease